MSEDKSEQELTRWRKKIEMIGIDIKGLDQETETGRFKLKTNLMNVHFINELDKNINIDLDNDVIALWHDESQLNRYIIGKEYKLLDPGYIYPEGWDLPFKAKIIGRDKS